MAMCGLQIKKIDGFYEYFKQHDLILIHIIKCNLHQILCSQVAILLSNHLAERSDQSFQLIADIHNPLHNIGGFKLLH